MLPEVTILICTYNRPKEIIEVIEALNQYVHYPKDRLKWLVCDDSSPDGYLTKLAKKPIWKQLNIQAVTTQTNSGWGANVNNGLQTVTTPYTFFIEDDYQLAKGLDLVAGVALIEAKPDVGMLRYRGTAGDHLIYHQFEADIQSTYDNEGWSHYRDGLGLPNKISYLQLDSGSPSLYVYSHGPHLKSSRFHQFYGLYPEGLKLGQTEEAYAHTVRDGMKQPYAPAIAILPEWVSMWFDHIGQSHQHTDDDK